jgi:NTE family protein
LTLSNYPKGESYTEPEWIDSALDPETRINNPRRFASAQIAKSYEDARKRPFIHLLDGGLSDNIGLRGPTHSLLSTDGQDSLLRMINNRQIRKIAVIHVNAKTGSVPGWDKTKRAPGLLGMVSTVTTAPMNDYSAETIQSLNEEIKSQFLQPRKTEKDFAKWLEKNCPDVNWPQKLPGLDFYEIDVSFDDVNSEPDRQKLKNLPANFHLPDETIDLLERSGAEVLRNSASFQRLVKDLQ